MLPLPVRPWYYYLGNTFLDIVLVVFCPKSAVRAYGVLESGSQALVYFGCGVYALVKLLTAISSGFCRILALHQDIARDTVVGMD